MSKAQTTWTLAAGSCAVSDEIYEHCTLVFADAVLAIQKTLGMDFDEVVMQELRGKNRIASNINPKFIRPGPMATEHHDWAQMDKLYSESPDFAVGDVEIIPNTGAYKEHTGFIFCALTVVARANPDAMALKIYISRLPEESGDYLKVDIYNVIDNVVVGESTEFEVYADEQSAEDMSKEVARKLSYNLGIALNSF